MPLIPIIKELERISILCPLGVRFWDAVTNASISDGLIVAAYPAGQPWLRREAFLTRSGIFAFRNLPGMRDVENGAGGEAFWQSPPLEKPFVVEMSDTRGHFLPLKFTLNVPV